MSDFLSDLADVFGFGDSSSATNSAENDRQAARAGSGSSGDEDDEDVVTIVRTSLRTHSATFDGEIGGFTTMAVGGAPIPKPTGDADESTIATDSDSLKTANANQGTNLAPAPTGDLAASENGAESSGGHNTAAKAGIAIGVLAAILVVAGLIWFFFMKRRKQERQSLDDDEKLHGPFNNPDDDRLTGQAPEPPVKGSRISLFSSMGVDKRMDKNVATAAAAVPNDRSGSAWERPFTSQSQNPANPFGNHAERMQTPIPEEPGRPVSPLDEANARGPQPVSPMHTGQPTFDNMATANGAPGGVAAAGVAAGAAVGLIRKQSRNYGPQPLDLTIAPPVPISAAGVPPSPAPTDYSVNSVTSGQTILATSGAAAIAAAGGPPASAVYRVQLDFKPTMEDELELRAGDLVRLLHEYDDGWALVIRLDRSQQGVVPRTCLSTRPVKPRPRPNNGPGPAPRGPAPINPTGRPMTPQGYSRPQSPAARPGTAHSNRPVSPASGQTHHQVQGPRSVSPTQSDGPSHEQAPMVGPDQQPRPQSPGPKYLPMPRPLSPMGVAPKLNATTAPSSVDLTPAPFQVQLPSPQSPTEAQPAPIPAPAASAIQAVQAVKAAQAAQAAQAAAAAAAAATTPVSPAQVSPAQASPVQVSPTQSLVAQSPPAQSPVAAQIRGPVNRKPVPKAAEAR